MPKSKAGRTSEKAPKDLRQKVSIEMRKGAVEKLIELLESGQAPEVAAMLDEIVYTPENGVGRKSWKMKEHIKRSKADGPESAERG